MEGHDEMRAAIASILCVLVVGAGCARAGSTSPVAAPPTTVKVPSPEPTSAPPAAPAVSPPKAPAPVPRPSAPVKPQTEVRTTARPSLDLASLEARLRATKAIGVLTKLSLKNQIDDLLEEFKLFHQGRGPALPTLRERYDLLLMKVQSLLQNDDPPLARDVSASRQQIWEILADPAKFASIN